MYFYLITELDGLERELELDWLVSSKPMNNDLDKEECSLCNSIKRLQNEIQKTYF